MPHTTPCYDIADLPDWIEQSQAAALLGRNVRTLQRYAEAGLIKPVRIARNTTAISRSDFFKLYNLFYSK
jgi:hypothetical protein